MTRQKSNPKKAPTENRESRLRVEHAYEMVRKLNISKLLVSAESVTDQRFIIKKKEKEKIIWLTRKKEALANEALYQRKVITLPEQALSRMDQFLLGLLIAVLRDWIKVDETVLCMTGLVGSLRLDNLLITNLERDHKWFQEHTFEKIPKEILRSREFLRVLDLALRFANQGREGKPVGTIFILGDAEKLEPYLKQLILNPCQGHKKSLRNIHNREFVETLRELSALDSAFIVSRRGVVERAAAYLDAPLDKKELSVPEGYGARHTSAAALTASTDSLAVVVSESSSSVTAFYDSAPILEINKS